MKLNKLRTRFSYHKKRRKEIARNSRLVSVPRLAKEKKKSEKT